MEEATGRGRLGTCARQPGLVRGQRRRGGLGAQRRVRWAVSSRATSACSPSGPGSRLRFDQTGSRWPCSSREAVGMTTPVGQEDFLVLAGECLLIVEEQERQLRPWTSSTARPEPATVSSVRATGRASSSCRARAERAARSSIRSPRRLALEEPASRRRRTSPGMPMRRSALAARPARGRPGLPWARPTAPSARRAARRGGTRPRSRAAAGSRAAPRGRGRSSRPPSA